MAEFVRYVERNAPRQQAIADYIRRMILSGKLPPGSRLPSVAQIVERFGTSNTTVQRAITHLRTAGFISPNGWRGNYVAENPPHLSHIGVVLPVSRGSQSESQFYVAWQGETQRFNESEASGETGTRLSLFYSSTIPAATADHTELIEAVESHQLAGLIFIDWPSVFDNTPVMALQALPRVVVAQFGLPRTIALIPSYERLFAQMIEFLHRKGRRRVAVICSFQQFRECVWLKEIIQPLLQEHGLETRDEWLHAVDLRSKGWAANCTRMLVNSNSDFLPDALIIADDNFVTEATDALAQSEIDIPAQLEVIAHCNFPHPTIARVPVTRIGFDVRGLLETSIEVIRRKRSGEEVPDEVRIEPQFENEQAFHGEKNFIHGWTTPQELMTRRKRG